MSPWHTPARSGDTLPTDPPKPNPPTLAELAAFRSTLVAAHRGADRSTLFGVLRLGVDLGYIREEEVAGYVLGRARRPFRTVVRDEGAERAVNWTPRPGESEVFAPDARIAEDAAGAARFDQELQALGLPVWPRRIYD